MEHILQNKKGVSMAELIAYVALYGVVMSLLASLVFVIVQAARKVNAQSILNRGATIMYTEILSETIRLNPDSVSEVSLSDDENVISVTFEKQYYYTDDGERKYVKDSDEYNGKVIKIVYSYTKGEDNIDVAMYTKGATNPSTTTINLDYGMTITSHPENGDDTDSIANVFKVDTQNTSNKYVTFHGDLHYDNKKMEFNFIVPVFTAKED